MDRAGDTATEVVDELPAPLLPVVGFAAFAVVLDEGLPPALEETPPVPTVPAEPALDRLVLVSAVPEAFAGT